MLNSRSPVSFHPLVRLGCLLFRADFQRTQNHRLQFLLSVMSLFSFAPEPEYSTQVMGTKLRMTRPNQCTSVEENLRFDKAEQEVLRVFHEVDKQYQRHAVSLLDSYFVWNLSRFLSSFENHSGIFVHFFDNSYHVLWDSVFFEYFED